MDTPELARHQAAADRCKMERWAVDFTNGACRVVTTAGRHVATFEQPEDAIATCWLHEQQAILTAALADAIKARENAVIAMERAQNAEMAEHEHRMRVERVAEQRVHGLASDLNTAKANLDICQRSKTAMESSWRHHQTLAEAVGKWVRDRHSPSLVAAWERFTKDKDRGY